MDVEITYDASLDSCLAGWQENAVFLRPLLSHLSLWIGTANLPSEENRQLTRQGLQSLLIDRQDVNVDNEQSLAVIHVETCKKLLHRNLRLYSVWFKEDAQLLQVVEAWNAVVERGEADVVKCTCDWCQHYYNGRLVAT